MAILKHQEEVMKRVICTHSSFSNNTCSRHCYCQLPPQRFWAWRDQLICPSLLHHGSIKIKHAAIFILKKRTKHTTSDLTAMPSACSPMEQNFSKVVYTHCHQWFFLLNPCQSGFHVPSPDWNLKITNDIHVAINNKFSVLFIPNPMITLDTIDLFLTYFFAWPPLFSYFTDGAFWVFFFGLS